MKAEWTNKDSLSIESTGQKAVLVIDMPERCVVCPLCEGEGYPLCTAIHKSIGSLAYYFGGDKERNPYCPLRPLPEKMTIKIPDGLSESSKMTIHSILRVGWESCIKEILGETE